MNLTIFLFDLSFLSLILPKREWDDNVLDDIINIIKYFTALVHIGELIKQTLKQRHKSVVWFAGELSCSRTNVYKIFSKPSIDSSDLLRISKILDYDFFEIYSKELKNQ